MTYTITDNCIGCQRCLFACPSDAIQTDGSTFWIDAHRCNQCQGTAGVPQCWAVCPTNEGCVALSAEINLALAAGSESAGGYWQAWFEMYTRMVARLKASKQPEYWQQWFDSYSQILRNLQTEHGNGENVPLMP